MACLTSPAQRWAAMLVGLLLAGCALSPDDTVLADARAQGAIAEQARLVRLERTGWYPAWFLRLALWYTEVPGPTPLRCGVQTFRVLYRTVNVDGTPTVASGLYAEPTCRRARAVVSYQHGTVTRREDVPSALATEGLAAAGLFAGGGYLLVAADYLGMGAHDGVHPYLHRAATASAAEDLLRTLPEIAARRGRGLPAQLLLAGFSQGGHATLALQDRLEAADEGLRPTAVAAGSAPFDLAERAFPNALAGRSKDHSAYLALLTHAYCDAEGQALGGVLQPPWDAAAAGILVGAFDEDDLPRDPRLLFTADFLEARDAGREDWFQRALRRNSTHRIVPRAPLRVYGSSTDEIAPAQDAQAAVAAMQAAGADVRYVDLGALDHLDGALVAVQRIRAWFDALTDA